MTEYINRSALFEKLHAAGGCDADPDTWAAGYDTGIDLAIDIVRKEPTDDVVEVVRCGQCRYREPVVEGGKVFYVCNNINTVLVEVKPNEYCSYGARKDGADDAC